jgi:Tol biopolymer transport system component
MLPVTKARNPRVQEFHFATSLWDPFGKFIYFERPYQGATNIWKMSISAATLSGTAVERLTTGAGPDTQAAISPDRKRLAFTIGAQHIRSWLFPFNATTGQITGSGQAIPSPGSWAFEHSLSRDGKKLAFLSIRGGRELGLWEKSLVDGREAPVVSDDNWREYPQWSPDGTTLAYTCWRTPTLGQLMLWHSNNRTEEPVTAPTTTTGLVVYDWSPNGKQLRVSKESSETHRQEVGFTPRRELRMQKTSRDGSLLIQLTIFGSHIFLLMPAGLYLRLLLTLRWRQSLACT